MSFVNFVKEVKKAFATDQEGISIGEIAYDISHNLLNEDGDRKGLRVFGEQTLSKFFALSEKASKQISTHISKRGVPLHVYEQDASFNSKELFDVIYRISKG